MYPWRSVGEEGAVLDLVVQDRRDTETAVWLLRRRLQSHAVEPEAIATDGLASFGAVLARLDLRRLHRPGRLQKNNRVEKANLPIRRRERKQQGFRSQASTLTFLTTPEAIYDTFNIRHHLIRRPALRRFRAAAVS